MSQRTRKAIDTSSDPNPNAFDENFLLKSSGEKNGGNERTISTLLAPGMEPGTSRTTGKYLSHYTTGWARKS